MSTIAQPEHRVTGAVDTHKDQHVAAALDHIGRLLGTAEFPATAAGYQQLHAWLTEHGDIVAVGIEGCGSWGAGLARYLTSQDVVVTEVNRPNREVLAGFLGGYSGLTREACALDLRQFAQWCHDHDLGLFAVHRADIDALARHLEHLGPARATIARRLCTVCCFYGYAVEEGALEHSPAVHVRRPRLDYDSNAVGLDRNEVGALLVAAGLAGAWDHALISLLALNGLRVSEAVGADIERLGVERGHRTLTVLGKGGKTVTLPLAFCDAAGQRLDRHGAARIVRRTARQAGIAKRVGPHTLRHAFITAALDAGVPLRDVQEAASHADPRTTMRYDRARVSLDRHAMYIVSTFIAGASR